MGPHHGLLRLGISQSEFKIWFSGTSLKKLDSDHALIEAPNKFIASWLTDNYLNQIRDSFQSNLSILPSIRFTFSQPYTNPGKLEHTSVQKSQANFPHQIKSLWTFNNFITAKSNRFAYSSALEIASNPAQDYNPFYVYSKVTCGKTHLLNAIGDHFLSTKPSARVRYDSAESFCLEFSRAAKNQKLTQFRENYQKLDLLLLDDIHFLAGRERSQTELISLFNALCQLNRQIVVASTMSPSQTQNLNPRLRSRMEGGLLSEIQIPDQKTRMKIIKKKLEEVNLHVPEDVIFFLTNTTNDLKAVMQYLVRLETFASLYQREINMSTVKLIINERHLSKKNLDDIQKLVAQYFNISLSDLLSNKKRREFSYPRQLAMYLSRKFTSFSFKNIGKAFGNKDHSTVIYAVKRVERDMASRKEVLADIQRIEKFLS